MKEYSKNSFELGEMLFDQTLPPFEAQDFSYLSGANSSGANVRPKHEHSMGTAVEYADGKISGTCVTCEERISVTKLPTGFGLVRLKALIIDAIGDPDDMVALLAELDRVERILEIEEMTLNEANKLVALARKMIEAAVT